MGKDSKTLFCFLPLEYALFQIYCDIDFGDTIFQMCDLIWKYLVF